MRAQRKEKSGGRRGAKSEYGRQMLEKQKARYSYGVASGQFSSYVNKALQTSGDNTKNLLRLLEGRLDNVVVRAGFAPTRSAARQMVSHGHIMVGGKRVTVPSYQISVGEVVSIRPGSKNKVIFSKLDESVKETKVPAWLSLDIEKREIKVVGEPTTDTTDLLFDVRQVLEFYTR